MSLHLIECVRPLRLTPSTKLALLAFADSADRETRISFPGFEAVMEWAGVSRSRAFEIVAELIALGLLRKHYRGHNGRRSEYVVFPSGCCDLHPTPGGDDTDEAIEINPYEAGTHQPPPPGEGFEAMAARLGDGYSMGPVGRTQPAEVGSGPPDSVSGEGSGPPDPTADPTQGRVRPTGPNEREGSGKGPAHRTPSLTTTTTPPTPHASGAGGASCALHDTTPTTNCRACGTTSRQLAKRAHRDAADQAAQQAIAAGTRCPGGRPFGTDGICGCPPPVTHELLAAVTAGA